MKTINFYSTRDEYGCFSNFYRSEVFIWGIHWLTSEQAFQAAKFSTSVEDFLAVMNAKTPSEAATVGRDRNRKLREDWEKVKDNIMRDVVYAKFTQHEGLKALLLSTEDAILVEHTINDSYWGDGGDGTGKNMLGKILMETRERIKNEN